MNLGLFAVSWTWRAIEFRGKRMQAEHLHSTNRLLSTAVTAEKAWTGRTWARCSRSLNSTSRMKHRATTHMTPSRSNGAKCVRPSRKVRSAAISRWSLQKPSKVKQVRRSVIRRHNILSRRKWQMIIQQRRRRKAQKLRGCFNRGSPRKDLWSRLFKCKDRCRQARFWDATSETSCVSSTHQTLQNNRANQNQCRWGHCGLQSKWPIAKSL